MIGTVAARQPEIARDGFGRPKVVPPTGGAPVAYTRCTTFVGSIEDMYLLQRWQQRHVAKGVAAHGDLIAAINDTPEEDKKGLNDLVDEALLRSGAGDSAKVGTYLHSVTEAYDRGEDPWSVDPPALSTGMAFPEDYKDDLEAYVEATAELQAVQIEQFVVQDPLRIGGTPDRVVRFRGKRYIADLKTGAIEHGTLKIAAQLAVYARSRPYDVATGERMEPHGAELDRGIIIHLPQDWHRTGGRAECRLWWVDLMKGWEAVRVCRDVRTQRQQKFPHLASLLTTPPPAPQTLADRITVAASRDEVTALWQMHAAEWTPELTELARRHLAVVEGTTPTPTPTEGTSRV